MEFLKGLIGERVADVFASATLLFLAALLVAPLWYTEYHENWGSIYSTFIADARMLVDHWPNLSWQRLWYCGTRFDYIYPPAIRYWTAGIAMLLGVPTARAYHLYTALLYCAGIVGVYAMVRMISSSRRSAWVSSLAFLTLSVVYSYEVVP